MNGFILLLGYVGTPIIKALNLVNYCKGEGNDPSICLNLSLIVRVGLALFILHLIIILCLLTKDSFAKYVNENLFMVKFLMIFVIIFLLTYIPNSALSYFIKIS